MKDFPAPNCPEDIGIKFYLFTRENPEYEDRVEMSQDNSQWVKNLMLMFHIICDDLFWGNIKNIILYFISMA